MRFHFANFGLPRPFHSRVMSRHATDTAHHFIHTAPSTEVGGITREKFRAVMIMLTMDILSICSDSISGHDVMWRKLYSNNSCSSRRQQAIWSTRSWSPNTTRTTTTVQRRITDTSYSSQCDRSTSSRYSIPQISQSAWKTYTNAVYHRSRKSVEKEWMAAAYLLGAELIGAEQTVGLLGIAMISRSLKISRWPWTTSA